MSRAALDYVNVGESYDYPNMGSYASGERAQGSTLSKGAIFSMFRNKVAVVNGVSVASPSTMYLNTKTIDTTLYKRFQYNPAEIQMSINTTPIDPASTTQAGGAAAGILGVGAMDVSFEMRFTRDTEVYRAENRMGGGRYNAEAAEIFRRIGVQKDIYDLYRVMLGNDGTDQSLPSDMSMRALTGRAFDLSQAGGLISGRPVAVIFNDDLVFYGYITSLGVVYNKFNKKLVPTWATANVSMSCVNMRPDTYGSTFFGTSTTPASSTTLGSSPTSGVAPSTTSTTPMPSFGADVYYGEGNGDDSTWFPG